MENTVIDKIEEPLIQLVPANYGKRFANYFIDLIFFSLLASFVLMFIAPVYPLATKIMNKQPISLTDQLMVTFIYGLYMSVMEALLKGKTIGKYITGTRAVDINGLPVSSQTAFIRGLIRMIPFPFEQVSAFSFSFEPFSLRPPYPWHDRWSRSIVVDEAKSLLPKK